MKIVTIRVDFLLKALCNDSKYKINTKTNQMFYYFVYFITQLVLIQIT